MGLQPISSNKMPESVSKMVYGEGQNDIIYSSNKQVTDVSGKTITIESGVTITPSKKNVILTASEKILCNGTIDASGTVPGGSGGRDARYYVDPTKGEDGLFIDGTSGGSGGDGGSYIETVWRDGGRVEVEDDGTDGHGGASGGNKQLNSENGIPNMIKHTEIFSQDIGGGSGGGGGGWGGAGASGDMTGGNGGAGGDGGNGGGIIWLAAPEIEINGVLRSRGTNGSSAGRGADGYSYDDAGGGGGGGGSGGAGGVVVFTTENKINNGNIDLRGGSGGAGGVGGSGHPNTDRAKDGAPGDSGRSGKDGKVINIGQ